MILSLVSTSSLTFFEWFTNEYMRHTCVYDIRYLLLTYIHNLYWNTSHTAWSYINDWYTFWPFLLSVFGVHVDLCYCFHLCKYYTNIYRHVALIQPSVKQSHRNITDGSSQCTSIINTLRPRQDGRHFADDTFKYIFLNENVMISLKISLKFVPKGPINNIPALVQIMAWRRPDDKPLSELMMVSLLTHICVTRPQWVKSGACWFIDWNYICVRFLRAAIGLDNCYAWYRCQDNIWISDSLDMRVLWLRCVNTLRPRQNGRHFADAILKHIFLNENIWIPIKISLKFVPKGSIYKIPALVQIMAWRRPGDKPLSEPMMVNLPTHICVTRPQWGNASCGFIIF